MDDERAEVDSPEPDEQDGEPKPAGTLRLSRSQDAESVDRPTHLVVCPVCQLKNPNAETFCAECGFLLTSKLDDFAGLPGTDDLASFPHLEDAGGRGYPLRPGLNTVGRENTDILIVDRSVSRYHGMIVYDEERNIFSVEDAGSTNGSQINGEKLSPHSPRPMHPGDNLIFGNIAVRFIADGSGGRAPELSDSVDADEPTLPNAPGLASNEPAARLVLLRGNGPREVVVEQGFTTIGRTPDNKICLNDDKYVSGHHAKIEADGELFLLLDVGSTNGTFLNGLRLTTNTAIAISDGDEILIGGLLFQFHRLTGHIYADSGRESTLLGSPSFDLLSVAGIGSDPGVTN